MDISNFLSVIVGGILAIIGGIIGATYSAKRERERIFLERKITIYLEFLPIISSWFTSKETKNYDLTNSLDLETIISKVQLFCNTSTRKNIQEFTKRIYISNKMIMDGNIDNPKYKKLYEQVLSEMEELSDKIVDELRNELKNNL